MDARTILKLKPELTRFLNQFDGYFGRVTTRRYLDLYVEGQLSNLPRKSLEPMADAFGEPPRNLQEFLGLFRWEEQGVRDQLQQHVARRHGHPQSVGVIDETSFVKKGVKTACVQRQHCGAVGKTENCVVSVHLGYATPEFYSLIDGEVYLPQETWDNDRQRCREAGIPDEVVYRPKWQMAHQQYRRAVANGVRFAWLTFDEGYGGKGPFLRAVEVMSPARRITFRNTGLILAQAERCFFLACRICAMKSEPDLDELMLHLACTDDDNLALAEKCLSDYSGRFPQSGTHSA